MPAIYIRVDDDKAVKWMQQLIATSIQRPGAAARENFSFVQEWHRAMANPVKAKDVSGDVEIQELIDILNEADLKIYGPKPARRGRPPKVQPKQKRQKKVVEEIDDPYSCKEHPGLKYAQAPRKDCTKCWDIYKALHPQEYALKRRQFEQKQKG